MTALVRYSATFVLALALAACDDDPAEPSQPTTFNVVLTADDEVPVCNLAGVAAGGTATVTINAQNTLITVTNLNWSGLSGPATVGHIHIGAVGVAGPPVINFGANPPSPFNAVYSADDYPSPVPAGAPATFALFVQAMKAGNTYINIHTNACEAGEIRGQLLTGS